MRRLTLVLFLASAIAWPALAKPASDPDGTTLLPGAAQGLKLQTPHGIRPAVDPDFFGDQHVLIVDLDRQTDLPSRGGTPDVENFELYRITDLDPVTKKPSRGLRIESAIDHVVPEGPLEPPQLPRIFYVVLNEKLAFNASYSLYIREATLKDFQGGRATTEKVSLRGTFATAPELTLTRGPLTVGLDYLELRSNLPLAIEGPGKPTLYTVRRSPTGEEVEVEVPIDVDYAQSPEDAGLTRYYSVRLRPKPLRTFKAGRPYVFRVKGSSDGGSLRTLLDPAWVLKPPEDYEREGTLISEEDARYFIQLFSQVADDEAPILAAKVNLKIPERHVGKSWWYQPSLSADVGSDNSESKNNVKILPVAFTNFRTRDPLAGLAANQFDLSAGLETDKDFDKRNWMLTGTYLPWFKGAVKPVATRNELRKSRNEENKPDGPFEPPAKFGWSFKPTFGVEIGRSLQAGDGLVKNKAETQEVTVPDHDVARALLKIEAVLEYRSFAFKLVSELRHLAEDEFVAVLDDDDNLSLRTVDGFRDFHTLGIEWAFDPGKRFVLGMEYQQGEAPPKYSEVDTLKTTFTVKF